MINIEKIRADFPILNEQVYGHKLVYLDNAATTQKPKPVVESIVNGYYHKNANVHRGVHWLSQEATEAHEAARETVRKFINAEKTSEIIFTRGTTESLNIVAATFGELLNEGDEIIVSQMEHHSNIVPWQLQATKRGIRLRVIPLRDDYRLDLDAFRQLFTDRTRLVSVTHVSNVLGTQNPIADIVSIAHEHGVPVLVDAAQSAPHKPLDVQALDCDFLALSGHKMYGPTGIGVLYGREEWLDRLPPYQGGGEMIDRVTWEHTTFERLPFKFEAGTPDYIATHGLATAIDYMESLGLENIAAHEHELGAYAYQQLQQVDGIHVYAPTSPSADGTPVLAREWGGALSFNVGNIHHLDLGTLLDRLGVAVRTGHHCAQPLMDRLQVQGTVRASFALYNTRDDVDAFVAALQRVVPMLQ